MEAKNQKFLKKRCRYYGILKTDLLFKKENVQKQANEIRL